jgi:hypothetical protein
MDSRLLRDCSVVTGVKSLCFSGARLDLTEARRRFDVPVTQEKPAGNPAPM